MCALTKFFTSFDRLILLRRLAFGVLGSFWAVSLSTSNVILTIFGVLASSLLEILIREHLLRQSFLSIKSGFLFNFFDAHRLSFSCPPLKTNSFYLTLGYQLDKIVGGGHGVFAYRPYFWPTRYVVL
jgi:hypothetical protein